MRILFYILLVLIALFGISFAALNAESVTFHYYVGTKQLPLSFLLAFCLTLGILLGWLVSLSMFLRAKREIFTLKAKLKQVSKPTTTSTAMKLPAFSNVNKDSEISPQRQKTDGENSL